MNPREIYAKTEEGLRELKERKLNLPIALRSVLIMIDGNRSVAEVLQKTSALHVDTSALVTLEQAGLIVKRFSAPSASEGRAGKSERSQDEVQRFLSAQQQMSDAINR